LVLLKACQSHRVEADGICERSVTPSGHAGRAASVG
jgi:hypothetical protein